MKAILCKTGSSVKHEVREGGREGGGGGREDSTCYRVSE